MKYNETSKDFRLSDLSLCIKALKIFVDETTFFGGKVTNRKI